MVQQCNHYLKWAFIACPLDCQRRLAGQAREAANVVVRQRHRSNWSGKYVVRLFERTRQRKGHAVAVGATARYLAEATYWVLTKGEPYREPVSRPPAGLKSSVSPKQGQACA